MVSALTHVNDTRMYTWKVSPLPDYTGEKTMGISAAFFPNAAVKTL